MIGLAALAAALAVGLLAGLLSGLVGIGGGVLMVPFLYFFYAHPALAGVRLPPEMATLAAHATSLFVILPTSLRGAAAFHRQRLVAWRAALPIGAAAAVAAALATLLAEAVDPRALRLAFGALLLVSAWRLFRTRPPRTDGDEDAAQTRPPRLSLPVTTGVGAAIGGFSALLGVGGGIVGIPLMLQVVRLDLRRVAATSLAVIALTSAAGAAAYMLNGPDAAVRPGASAGYVDLPVAAALAVGALVSVAWGTRLNRRLNARTLALVFAVLLSAVGARLVALNLPV